MAESDIADAAGDAVIGDRRAARIMFERRLRSSGPAVACGIDHDLRNVNAAIGDVGARVAECQDFQQRAITAPEIVEAERYVEVA